MKTQPVKRSAQTARAADATRLPVVRFELANTSARSVCVAGTFNNWKPEVTEMVSVAENRWAKDLVLPPGRHEYRFVVDGQWISDPKCAETAANPFGGVNSVVTIPSGITGSTPASRRV